MSITLTVTKEGQPDEVFTNIIGHQVGYSHIQVLLADGDQRIISNFDSIDVSLDEESKEAFKASMEAQKAASEAKQDAPEKISPTTKLASVPDSPS